jgi:hypothetical protein
MERIATIACAGVLAAIIGAMAWCLVMNPMHAKRERLNMELAKIEPVEVPFDKPNWDFDKWQRAVASKPGLWDSLIAPPPPPPPPPEKPPDVNAMAKDLSFGRQQIGNKVKMTKAKDAKGSFVTVGDKVNGLIVKEITKTAVVLSLEWKGQELTVSVPRK